MYLMHYCCDAGNISGGKPGYIKSFLVKHSTRKSPGYYCGRRKEAGGSNPCIARWLLAEKNIIQSPKVLRTPREKEKGGSNSWINDHTRLGKRLCALGSPVFGRV